MTHNLYLTDRQAAERLGVSKATIWRWANEGRFPRPLKLSSGATRWRKSEIEAWEGNLERGFVTHLDWEPKIAS